MDQKTYRLEEQIGYVLRLANQRHAVIFQHHALMNLTPTQFSALVCLAKVTSCSQNMLGRLISVDVATIKGVVDRLNKKGLISLAADPGDKRRTLITLSPETVNLIPDLCAIGQTISEETLRPLTISERGRLLQLLKKIT